MSKVNDIFVGVGGSAQGLIDSLNSGVKSITEFKTKALSMAAPYAGAAAAVAAAGAVVVGTLAAMTKSGLDLIDQQSKASRNLGLSTEQMVGLAHAAQLSDVEFESLGNSLNKLGINLANANKETVETIDSLGLSINELRGGDIHTAFTKIVGALSSVQSTAQRAALAQKLMGKGAKDVMALLSGGPEELAKMAAEAEHLGLTFSSIDGQKVEAANDAMTNVSNAVQGASNALAIHFAPAIKSVADLTTEWLVSSRQGFTEFLPTIDQVAAATALLADVGQTLATGGWVAVTEVFRQIQQQAATVSGAFALMADTADAAQQKLISTWQAAGKLFGTDVSFFTSFWNGVNARTKGIAEASKGYADAAQKNADAALAARDKAIASFKLPHDGVFAAFDKVKAEFDKLENIKPTNIGDKIATDIEQGMEKATEAAHKNIEKLKSDLMSVQMGEGTAQRTRMANDGVDDSLIQETKVLQQQLEEAKVISKLKHEIAVLQSGDTAATLLPPDAFAGLSEESRILIEQLATTKKLAEEEKKRSESVLNRAKQQKHDLASKAKELTESLLSPVDKAQKRFEDLEKMLSEGLISTDTFNKAADKNRADLADSGKPRFAQMALKGSQEAREITLNSRFNTGDKVLTTAQKSLVYQQQMANGIKALVSKKDAETRVEEIRNI